MGGGNAPGGREEHGPLLDLNTESLAAVQKMGGGEANTLAVEAPPAVVSDGEPDNSVAAPKDSTGFDYTHLGPKGSAFFGKMVARELRNAVSAVRPCFRP